MLLAGGLAAAQERSYFGWTTDPKVVAKQIQLSLPAAQRGLELLQAATTDTQITVAVASIFDAYRYLRAAQESSENIEAYAKVKDPMVPFRNARILQIRDQLRWCREHREELLRRDQEATAQCQSNVMKAIHDLQIVVVTVN